MRARNRVLSLLLAAAIILTCVPGLTLHASAAQYTGDCGNDLTWTYDKDTARLTISGTGKMYSYDYHVNPEWYKQGLNKKLKTLIIENGVEDIGAWAIPNCPKLKSVRIADTVTSIGEYAFYACKNLQSLTIPDSVAVIGNDAFSDCESLETLVFLGDAPEMSDQTFNERTLTCYYPSEMAGWDLVSQYQFGGNVTWLACEPGELPELDDDFGDYDDKQDQESGGLSWDFDESDGTLTISGEGRMEEGWSPWGPEGAELHEEILHIVIEDGVESIGAYAFEECINLERITIPGSVAEIGNSAFSMCESLTEVEICEGVETIGDEVFVDCFNLISVTLPESLTRVGYGAFSWSGIEEVCFLGSTPEFDGEAFFGLEATVCYPEDDDTWTDAVRRNYGGAITWQVHGAGMLLGDVDASGDVNFFDGMYVLQYYAGVIDETQLNEDAADVDTSGDVNFFDGMYILQYYAGTIDKLPVEA